MKTNVVDHPTKKHSPVMESLAVGPRLVACSSVIRGKVIPVGEGIGLPFVIGSNQACDYVISGSTMEEFHVSVELVEGDWLLTSVDHNAQVWVNNEPVSVAVIEHGDQVQLGRHLLVFLANYSEDTVSDAIHVARIKLQNRSH